MNKQTAEKLTRDITSILQIDFMTYAESGVSSQRVEMQSLDEDDATLTEYVVLVWLALPPCDVKHEYMAPTFIFLTPPEDLEEMLGDEGADEPCGRCGAMHTELELRGDDRLCAICIYGLHKTALDV